MEKSKIEKIIDTEFEKELARINSAIEKELYPDAFANQYSYLRVKSAIKINNEAIRAALKQTMLQLLADDA